MSSVSRDQLRDRIRASSLWAAYGDAAGFITELTDRRGVIRRAGSDEVTTTVPWRRRVGGRQGAIVDLPAGAISDDTQLRLATSRAIGMRGFDVEAFSKIELTVWPSYALGAGRGSRAAAAALGRRRATWASNFFEDRQTSYVNGGGNGAAMRIQPHVWAASSENWLDDVIANSLCTHGHPRGFLGAVFHASCVDLALREQRPSAPGDWLRFVDRFREVLDRIRAHDTLRDLWLFDWEERAGRPLEAAIDEVAFECLEDIDKLSGITQGDSRAAYYDAVDALGAFEPAQRGSGTKTALLAAVVAQLFANDPAYGLHVCVNLLGTDTDTIGTMAGAIMGALTTDLPPGPVQDTDYLMREADRMWAYATGGAAPQFPYPDLLQWSPPKTQLDAVGIDPHTGDWAVAGLGPVDGAGEPHTKSSAPAYWQWLELWQGQQVLLKRRQEPQPLAPNQLIERDSAYAQGALRAGPEPGKVLREPEPTANGRNSIGADALAALAVDDLDRLTDLVIRSGFDQELTGRALLALADANDPVRDGSAFGAIILKALVARRAANGRRRGPA